MANIYTSVQEGLAAAERIFTTLDTQPAIRDEPGLPDLQISQGEIAFQDVRMVYPDGTVALDGVSFTVPAGQTLALVGPSGGGKTTSLNLIPRFWEATSGSIAIDGQNVATVSLASLRRQMALVAQDAILFDDTSPPTFLWPPRGHPREMRPPPAMPAPMISSGNLPRAMIRSWARMA